MVAFLLGLLFMIRNINQTLKYLGVIVRFGKDARTVLARNEATCVTNCRYFECYNTGCFVPRKDGHAASIRRSSIAQRVMITMLLFPAPSYSTWCVLPNRSFLH